MLSPVSFYDLRVKIPFRAMLFLYRSCLTKKFFTDRLKCSGLTYSSWSSSICERDCNEVTLCGVFCVPGSGSLQAIAMLERSYRPGIEVTLLTVVIYHSVYLVIYMYFVLHVLLVLLAALHWNSMFTMCNAALTWVTWLCWDTATTQRHWTEQWWHDQVGRRPLPNRTEFISFYSASA